MTLYLNSNRLKKLPKLHCAKLEVLYFVDNQITTLGELVASHLPKLANIRATNNLIEGRLPKLEFAELSSLCASGNLLTELA